MATANSLTAYRAIVDNQGKPLTEFMQMWQDLLDQVNGLSEQAAVDLLVSVNQQIVNYGAVYTAGLANVRIANLSEAAGGTERAGISAQWLTTSGGSWVNGGGETLSTVSAGDLRVFMSGPLAAQAANGPASGEYRILEGGVTVFTGLWSADGDGTWDLALNQSIEDTLNFSDPRVSTGSVTYDIEYRVLAGEDVQLLSYLYVERT